MYPEVSLSELVSSLKNLGTMLIPYNYPLAPITEEDDMSFFKTRDAVVDGYTVILHYQKCDYDSHLMETLQIYGKYSPFLPFELVCKLARKFLGGQELSLVEVFRDNRKIYCWSVCIDRAGNPIEAPYEVEVEKCTFGGLTYNYMLPSQVNLF